MVLVGACKKIVRLFKSDSEIRESLNVSDHTTQKNNQLFEKGVFLRKGHSFRGFIPRDAFGDVFL